MFIKFWSVFMFKSIINWMNQPLLRDDTGVIVGAYPIKHQTDLDKLLAAGYTREDMASMRLVKIKEKTDPESGESFSILIMESIPGHKIQGWVNLDNQLTVTGYLVPTPWMSQVKKQVAYS
jgi:hypothetical protein